VARKRWRFKFDRLRQRFLLTSAEKRVVIFVIAAFLLGLGTKYYRDTHSSPSPATQKMKQLKAVEVSKAKRTSPMQRANESDQ
jgi:hypothetical protein